MKEKIADLLKEIEKEHNITILFAVENGSRAWGIDSKDSDYDVRFVFYRPLEDYISSNKSDEVITAAFDENGMDILKEGENKYFLKANAL